MNNGTSSFSQLSSSSTCFPVAGQYVSQNPAAVPAATAPSSCETLGFLPITNRYPQAYEIQGCCLNQTVPVDPQAFNGNCNMCRHSSQPAWAAARPVGNLWNNGVIEKTKPETYLKYYTNKLLKKLK